MAAQFGPYVEPRAGVQRRQRLVQQQQPRMGGQRAGQRDPLRLPAGQPPRLDGRVVGQPHPLQQIRRARPRLGLGHAVAARPKATLSSAVRCGKSR